MATARTGRTLLLRDGLLVSSTLIAAMRTTSFRIEGESVDVSDKDSPSQHRELLPVLAPPASRSARRVC
jgi:hypothetical protein